MFIFSFFHFTMRSTLIPVQGSASQLPSPTGCFIMTVRCQIIRYTWRRHFQEKVIHPKNKMPAPPTWKQKKRKIYKAPRCHIGSPLMVATFYLFIHILVLFAEAGFILCKLKHLLPKFSSSSLPSSLPQPRAAERYHLIPPLGWSAR